MIILSAIIKHFEAEQIYVSSYGARKAIFTKTYSKGKAKGRI